MGQTGLQSRTRVSQRTRSIAFVGLSIALIAVSAWITVPLGPVPFTLQTFAVTFAVLALSPRQAVAAISGYLALGAVGVPVFSGMRGGVGMLAGPTGGFLWGWLFGVAAAALLFHTIGARGRSSSGDVAKRGSDSAPTRFARFVRTSVAEICAGVLFTAVSYVCGWAQFMAVTGATPEAAFAACVAPFLVIDVLKLLAAVACARAVRPALR